LLDTEPDIADPAAATVMPEPAHGAVTFEDVVFAYPTRPGEPVLHGLDLKVEPGETVAIVGPSGAGKSTLFSLILRFYDPQSGAVRLDGVNVADVKLADLRERIALVPQDTVIFSASILENIRFRGPMPVRGSHGGSPAGAGGRVCRAAWRGVQHPRGRARRDLVGWSAAAGGDCPGGAAFCTRCCCWMKPPARWMPRASNMCRRPSRS
jgi:hypothetical protein